MRFASSAWPTPGLAADDDLGDLARRQEQLLGGVEGERGVGASRRRRRRRRRWRCRRPSPDGARASARGRCRRPRSRRPRPTPRSITTSSVRLGGRPSTRSYGLISSSVDPVGGDRRWTAAAERVAVLADRAARSRRRRARPCATPSTAATSSTSDWSIGPRGSVLAADLDGRPSCGRRRRCRRCCRRTGRRRSSASCRRARACRRGRRRRGRWRRRWTRAGACGLAGS